MNLSSGRIKSGDGVRDFLHYYMMQILAQKECGEEEIIKTIEEESKDNEKYRPGGRLHISRQDLQKAVRLLDEKSLITRGGDGDRLKLTSKAHRLLEGFAPIREKNNDFKDQASSKLVSLIIEDAKERNGTLRVLDVGTGEGYLAFKLARVGFDVLGIDSGKFEYSRNCISNAREKSQDIPNLDFQVNSVESLPQDHKFDYVVSSQAMHCMQDQQSSTCAMCRLLKEGGILLASDFLVGLKGYFTHGFHCFLALTKDEWRNMLQVCGCSEPRTWDVEDFCVLRSMKNIRN